MTQQKYIKRNKEIYGLWKRKRMTFTAIGVIYGLTRERIRQIIRQIEEENV